MSKKRTIRRRGLSAGLSVLLCLSMLPMGALAEEQDGLKREREGLLLRSSGSD